MGLFRRIAMIGAAISAGLGFGGGPAIASTNDKHIDSFGGGSVSIYQPKGGRGKGGRRSTGKTGNAAALKRASIKRRNKKKNPRGNR